MRREGEACLAPTRLPCRGRACPARMAEEQVRCVRLALDRSLLPAHSVIGDGLMPFSRPLVAERGDRDPLHGGATDKEEVHRTSPLQGRLPASSADRLQTLTRRKTNDLAPRFMHRNVSGLQAWR